MNRYFLLIAFGTLVQQLTAEELTMPVKKIISPETTQPRTRMEMRSINMQRRIDFLSTYVDSLYEKLDQLYTRLITDKIHAEEIKKTLIRLEADIAEREDEITTLKNKLKEMGS